MMMRMMKMGFDYGIDADECKVNWCIYRTTKNEAEQQLALAQSVFHIVRAQDRETTGILYVLCENIH